MKSILKRLLCFHLSWQWCLNKPTDWRTDTRFAECEDCGKLKNVGYLGVLPPDFRAALEGKE